MYSIGQATQATESAPDAPSWGVEALRRVTGGRRPPRWVGPATTWAARLGPVLVVAATLLAVGTFFFLKQGYDKQHGIMGFVQIGQVFGERIGLQNQAVSTYGYDGQFYYYLATRPDLITSCATTPATCPLDAMRPMRVARILYPMTARLLALGQTALVPYALLAANAIAILLTTALVATLAVEAGGSRWLGAAAGLYVGEGLGLLRDLADPFSLLWVFLALLLLRRQRYTLAALAVAAALLTREQFIIIVPLLALPLLAQRRWGLLARTTVLALGPVVAWHLYITLLYGQAPLLTSGTSAATLVPLPFAGLWLRKTGPDFGLIVLSVAVPLVLACVIALRALWERGPRSLLTDPLPAMVLLYSLLMSLTSSFQWYDMWGPTRLAAPGLLLALLVAARIRWQALRISYATLLAITALLPMSLVVR